MVEKVVDDMPNIPLCVITGLEIDVKPRVRWGGPATCTYESAAYQCGYDLIGIKFDETIYQHFSSFMTGVSWEMGK